MYLPPVLKLGRLLLTACALFPLAACASTASSSAGTQSRRQSPRSMQRPATGVLHTVKKGDTLWRISRSYGVSMEDIVEANELNSESRISVGQKLLIPGALRPLAAADAGKSAASSDARRSKVSSGESASKTGSADAAARRGTAQGEGSSPGARVPTALKAKADDEGRDDSDLDSGKASAPLPFLPVDSEASRQYLPPPGTGGKPLSWPVRGVLYAKFGKRGQSVHDGIDIAAPEATPIRAAAAGKVLYSAYQKGYGNIIIIEHEGGLLTLYAHNRENLVKDGDKVRLGQVIARMGTGAETSGPYLHFEVRVGGEPKNPLNYLPPPR